MRPLKAAMLTFILTACSSDPTSFVTSLAPTQVDPDAGDTSADVGGVPDVRPTEADTSPDVDEPDARTDSGTDSTVEPSEDSGELPVPADQCTGPFDAEALTDRTSLQVTTWECLVDCGRDVAPDQVQACTLGCIDRTTELTPGCSGCFAELGTCALDAGCFETCADEPDGWRCAYCQWTSCREGFRACAGVEVWRTAEACEGVQWGGNVRNAFYCHRSESDTAESLERCLANVEATAADLGAACSDCSNEWARTLPVECPECVEDNTSLRCRTCANTSDARSAAVFCAGSEPTGLE